MFQQSNTLKWLPQIRVLGDEVDKGQEAAETDDNFLKKIEATMLTQVRNRRIPRGVASEGQDCLAVVQLTSNCLGGRPGGNLTDVCL